jgi:hypothetical protein
MYMYHTSGWRDIPGFESTRFGPSNNPNPAYRNRGKGMTFSMTLSVEIHVFLSVEVRDNLSSRTPESRIN